LSSTQRDQVGLLLVIMTRKGKRNLIFSIIFHSNKLWSIPYFLLKLKQGMFPLICVGVYDCD